MKVPRFLGRGSGRPYTPETGRIEFDGEDLLARAPHEISALGIARSFQNLGLFPSLSVRENVMLGAYSRARSGFLASTLRPLSTTSTECALKEEADDVLKRLELLSVADHRATGLPYGTLKRVELARAVFQRPCLLMRDEPASGLNHAEVEELAGLIRSFRDDFELTVILVEHNMGLVMGLCEHVIVLDAGEKIAEGEPRDLQENRRVIEAYLGAPPIVAMQIQRFEGENWKLLGDVIQAPHRRPASCWGLARVP